MNKALRKCTSLILSAILSLSVSLVAYASPPTAIFVDGTPGDTTIDMTTDVTNGDIVGIVESDSANPNNVDFFEGFSSSAGTDLRFDVNTNGEIVVARADLISSEGSRTRTYSIIADESGVGSIERSITINIAQAEVPPTLRSPGNITLLRYEEQGDNGQVFYSESATFVFDQNPDDTPDTLTLTEDGCTDSLLNDCNGLFTFDIISTINEFGGTEYRTVIYQPDYDYEDRGGVDYYDLTVRATDDRGLSSTETYRIQNANLGEIDYADSFNDDSEVFGIGDNIFIDTYISDSDTLYYYNQPRETDPLDPFGPPIAQPTVNPTLELQLDSSTANAELTNLPEDTFDNGGINLATGTDENFGGSGPGVPVTFLRFLYTVMEGDSSSDLSYNGVGAIDMGTAELVNEEFAVDNFNGSYYFEDGPGQPVIPIDLPVPGTTGSLSFVKDFVIDGIRPFINNSTGAAIETTHLEGDVIEFSLDFSEDLDLSGYDYGSTIDLDIGGTIVTAEDDFALTSGLAANQIGFTYTVLAGQLDTDGVDVVENTYTGGNIADLAGNDATVFTHSTFNLPNDLVGQVAAPAPSSGGGGGSSSSGGGSGSNPFGGSNNQPEPTDEPVEEDPVVEEEPEQEEQVSEEEPVQEEQVSEEEPTPTPVVVTPNPQPQPEPTQEPVEEEPVVEEEPEQEEQVSEEPEEEAEISFNGSLTTGNSGNGSSSSRQEVQECEEYDASEAYTDSQSYNCDASEEFIEEGENAPTIQLNLPKDRQSQYNNDDIVIGGKVSDKSIRRVEVIAISNGQTYSLGIADVDEGGKFLLRNVTNLPVNEDIVVYGRDVESPTQSPDYGLAINTNIRLIGTELISFAEKPLERLYESNEEGVDYWTFVSTNVINNGGLQATVKSELNTNHKAFWQSVMFGSTAITGSNSDQTVLYAPDETIEQLQPFSKHTVTILAEKAGANSQPLVVEYYVIPAGFGAGVAILLLILLFGGWYLYNKKKQIHEKEGIYTEQTELQQ